MLRVVHRSSTFLACVRRYSAQGLQRDDIHFSQLDEDMLLDFSDLETRSEDNAWVDEIEQRMIDCIKIDRHEIATKVFDKFKDKKVVEYIPLRMYNYLLQALVPQQEIERAFAVVRDMISSGIDPDTDTYTSMIRMCCSCGYIEKACEIYQHMISQGLRPTNTIANSLVFTHCKQRQFYKATQLLQSLTENGIPFDENSSTFAHLKENPEFLAEMNKHR